MENGIFNNCPDMPSQQVQAEGVYQTMLCKKEDDIQERTSQFADHRIQAF